MRTYLKNWIRKNRTLTDKGGMMENKEIKYTSDNGYTGILYGTSSFAVFDRNGKEVLHTGFREINTEKELMEFVENFNDFLESIER